MNAKSKGFVVGVAVGMLAYHIWQNAQASKS